MTPPDFAEVKAALLEARSRHGEERVRWLEGLADRAPAVHDEVVSLLAHEQAELPGLGALLGLATTDTSGRHDVPSLARRQFEDGPHRTYEILRLLGQGGFGDVYLARLRDGELVRPVAIKLLREPHADGAAVDRLRDEAQLLTALRHPVILAVLALVPIDGKLGLVTEYVQGEDLAACLHGSEPLPPRAVLEVAEQVADALSTAWQELGVVHRDVKPQNIRLGVHGNVKLLDFGIARADRLDRHARTGTDHLLGTVRYLAPERFELGRPPGPSSDVFALGSVLYEGLVHEPLFGALDLPQLVRLCSQPAELGGYLRDRLAQVADDELRELLLSMLAPDPDARPSAEDVARRCGELAHARPLAESLRRWSRRHAWPAVPELGDPPMGPRPARRRGVALLVAAAIAVVAAGVWWPRAPEPAAPPPELASPVPAVVPTAQTEPAPVPIATPPVPAPELSPDPPVPTPVQPASRPPEPAPRAAPELDPEPTPGRDPEPEPAPTSPEAPEPLPAEGPVVDVRISSSPRGATIHDAATGEALCVTPCEVSVPENQGRRLTLELGGATRTWTVRAGRNQPRAYTWWVDDDALRATTGQR